MLDVTAAVRLAVGASRPALRRQLQDSFEVEARIVLDGAVEAEAIYQRARSLTALQLSGGQFTVTSIKQRSLEIRAFAAPSPPPPSTPPASPPPPRQPPAVPPLGPPILEGSGNVMGEESVAAIGSSVAAGGVCVLAMAVAALGLARRRRRRRGLGDKGDEEEGGEAFVRLRAIAEDATARGGNEKASAAAEAPAKDAGGAGACRAAAGARLVAPQQDDEDAPPGGEAPALPVGLTPVPGGAARRTGGARRVAADTGDDDDEGPGYDPGEDAPDAPGLVRRARAARGAAADAGEDEGLECDDAGGAMAAPSVVRRTRAARSAATDAADDEEDGPGCEAEEAEAAPSMEGELRGVAPRMRGKLTRAASLARASDGGEEEAPHGDGKDDGMEGMEAPHLLRRTRAARAASRDSQEDADAPHSARCADDGEASPSGHGLAKFDAMAPRLRGLRTRANSSARPDVSEADVEISMGSNSSGGGSLSRFDDLIPMSCDDLGTPARMSCVHLGAHAAPGPPRETAPASPRSPTSPLGRTAATAPGSPSRGGWLRKLSSKAPKLLGARARTRGRKGTIASQQRWIQSQEAAITNESSSRSEMESIA